MARQGLAVAIAAACLLCACASQLPSPEPRILYRTVEKPVPQMPAVPAFLQHCLDNLPRPQYVDIPRLPDVQMPARIGIKTGDEAKQRELTERPIRCVRAFQEWSADGWKDAP